MTNNFADLRIVTHAHSSNRCPSFKLSSRYNTTAPSLLSLSNKNPRVASPKMCLVFAFPSSPSGALSLRGSTVRDNLPTDYNPHHLPMFHVNTPILYLPPLRCFLPPFPTVTGPPNIDVPSLSLHKALHHFRPLTDAYADMPYVEAFNWDHIQLPKHEEREWYIVTFRSKWKDGSDGGCQSLRYSWFATDTTLVLPAPYEAGGLTHEEAIRNGGVSTIPIHIFLKVSAELLQLIMYWYGVPNPHTGMNIMTCIWKSREHAIAAQSCPHHIQAMKLAAASFEVYTLERYILKKVKGLTGVTVEPFVGGYTGYIK